MLLGTALFYWVLWLLVGPGFQTQNEDLVIFWNVSVWEIHFWNQSWQKLGDGTDEWASAR